MRAPLFLARRAASTASESDSLFAALPAVMTPAVGAALVRRGFAVVDGALPPGGAATVRRELAALQAASLLQLNTTRLVAGAGAGGQTHLPKAGVWEAEPSAARGAAAAAAAAPSLADAAVDTTLSAMLGVVAPAIGDVAGPAFLKAQLNTGAGACFPIHFDTDEAVDGRRVTAIFYGGGGDGGVLRLWPTLDPAAPVDVAPLPGRAVLFSAARMPHRVLPASAPGRACFSVWLSARRPPPPPRPLASIIASLLAARAPPAVARATLLAEPDGRRALAAVRLGEAWRRSLLEAHPPGPALEAALAARDADTAAMEAAVASVGVDAREAGLGEGEGDPRPAWF
jgi:hypothetical protein